MTRILAVDDSSTIRQCLAITFASTEYDLVLCNGPIEALAAVIQSPPALVLADATLKPTDGYALCEQLRENAPGLPVVIMASKQTPFDAVRGEYASGYIDKPFDSQKLQDKVREVIEAARQAQSQAPEVSTQDGLTEAGSFEAQSGSFLLDEPGGQGGESQPPVGSGPPPPLGAVAPIDFARNGERQTLPGLSNAVPPPRPPLSSSPPSASPLAPPSGLPSSPHLAPPSAPPLAPPSGLSSSPPASPASGYPDVDLTPQVEVASADDLSASSSITPTPLPIDEPADDLDELDQPSYSAMPAPPVAFQSDLPKPPSVTSDSPPIFSSPVLSESAAPETSESAPPDSEDQRLTEFENNGLSSWPAPNDDMTISSPIPRASGTGMSEMQELSKRLRTMGLTAAQVEGVLELSREVIERVVWEVVPTMAEALIKEEIERITKD